MWPTTRVVAACLAAGTCLLGGCRRQQLAESRQSAERPAGPVQEVALRTIDAAGLAQAVQEQRGKVVLVDYWATWCEPCIKLFPHTVDLEHRFRETGLTVITVSLDDPESAAAVRRYLRQQLASRDAEAIQNFLGSYGVGSEAFTAFDIGDGALPHVKLYRRDGRLLQSFLSGGGAIDPQKIEAAVAQSLK
jgi:thiol-disulfide isomerase/thioredoxin